MGLARLVARSAAISRTQSRHGQVRFAIDASDGIF